jgi:hypothetical protein
MRVYKDRFGRFVPTLQNFQHTSPPFKFCSLDLSAKFFLRPPSLPSPNPNLSCHQARESEITTVDCRLERSRAALLRNLDGARSSAPYRASRSPFPSHRDLDREMKGPPFDAGILTIKGRFLSFYSLARWVGFVAQKNKANAESH